MVGSKSYHLDGKKDLRGVELIQVTSLYDQSWEERRVVKLYEVPSLLIKALLAAEDQRFFEHEGIDPLRILGAGLANYSAGRTTQGGSTLTQQLVKNFFLTQERTLRRKMVEACISLVLELHYSKLEILENYLNEIYLGQRGAKSILGMWEAARFYFGKSAT
jgi:penicillin-binding protein 1B